MNENKTNEKMDNITGTLQQLIEQSQLKASLLKMEARDTWSAAGKIFSKIQSFMKKDWQQTEQDMDEALLHMHLGMMEAREEWNEAKTTLNKTITGMKTAEKFDHALVQAHLGKMEVDDRFKEKRAQWQKDYQEKIKPHIEASMDEMHKEMEIMAQSMID